MKTLNIHQAKTHLSAVLAEIEEKGETVLICRNGQPIADLVRHRRGNRLARHRVMSKVKLHYDPTEPLTAEEWPAEEA